MGNYKIGFYSWPYFLLKANRSPFIKFEDKSDLNVCSKANEIQLPKRDQIYEGVAAKPT